MIVRYETNASYLMLIVFIAQYEESEQYSGDYVNWDLLCLH